MPSNKVSSAAFAGALTAIIIWSVKQWGAVEIPGEVAAGLTTILSLATGYVVTD